MKTPRRLLGWPGSRIVTLLLAVASASPAPAFEPSRSACQAEASLEPSWAYPGQQVVYRVRILQSEDVTSIEWIEPLSFPSLRVEWLPGRSPDRKIAGIGAHLLVSEERRALFAMRSGTLPIPAATVQCTLSPGSPAAPLLARIPALALEVRPLPEAERPDGFTGLIGPVEASTSANRHRARLGESVALSLTILGAHNVWRARPDLAHGFHEAEVDVFAQPPQLSFERGRRLEARVSFRFDLVPRREGALRIPALRIPYFDPSVGRYAFAATPPIDVQVGARGGERSGFEGVGPQASSPLAPALESNERQAQGERESKLRWWSTGAAVIVAAFGGFWIVRRRFRRLAPTVRRCLAESDRAARRGEMAAATAALARAIRTALASRLPRAPGLAAEEILAHLRGDAPGEAAARLLIEIDRERFTPQDARRAQTAAPSASQVRRVLRKL